LEDIRPIHHLGRWRVQRLGQLTGDQSLPGAYPTVQPHNQSVIRPP
jgi:hypothetical protein